MRLSAKVAVAIGATMMTAMLAVPFTTDAVAQNVKPNIVNIMGDDIGMWNISAYSRGMMAGRTSKI